MSFKSIYSIVKHYILIYIIKRLVMLITVWESIDCQAANITHLSHFPCSRK